jgi:hypothetical protein
MSEHSRWGHSWVLVPAAQNAVERFSPSRACGKLATMLASGPELASLLRCESAAALKVALKAPQSASLLHSLIVAASTRIAEIQLQPAKGPAVGQCLTEARAAVDPE